MQARGGGSTRTRTTTVERRIAHPLHILCLDHVWYLDLWDPMRKAIRRFMLSRMHAITGTGESFRPRRFDVEKEIAKSFGSPAANRLPSGFNSAAKPRTSSPSGRGTTPSSSRPAQIIAH